MYKVKIRYRSGAKFMKDTYCTESYEKLDFSDFFVFELRLILFTIYGDTPGVTLTKQSCSEVVKFTGKMRIDLK